MEAAIGSKTLTMSKASVCECMLQRLIVCGNFIKLMLWSKSGYIGMVVMAINKKLDFHVCLSSLVSGAVSDNVGDRLAELAVPSKVISKCKHRCRGNSNLDDLLLHLATIISSVVSIGIMNCGCTRCVFVA